MKKPVIKVPLSLRALLGRINRKLAHDGERLRASRSDRYELGDYYILSDRNCIVAKDIDPETLGREIGVLHPYEKLIAQ